MLDAIVLSDDLQPEKSTLTSGAWLASQDRGAYTTARTVHQGSSIFELSFHIQRLEKSMKLMNGDSINATTIEHIRPRVLESIRKAVVAYYETHPTLNTLHQSNQELKVTVLITWDSDNHNNIHINTHISSLGSRPSPPVKIQIRGSPRENAEAKDSQWVTSRKIYEDQMPIDVNEVVLVGEDNGVYEGLSSNFFALVNGSLYTAGEGILKGSVRESVLRVAKKQGVPIVLQPPKLDDINTWSAAFISSTSRLLLPVDEVLVYDSSGNETYNTVKFHRTELVDTLERETEREIEENSEPIN